MITKKRGFLIAGVFLVILLCGIVIIKTPRLTSKELIDPNDIVGFLKDGDIMCRLGDRFWSQYFKGISSADKRFSHLGIVRIQSGNISVVNAEGLAIEGKDFVNEVTLRDFLKNARSIGVYRLKNYDGKLISDAALEFKGRPFDWEFNLDKDDKLYCSELLYVIIKTIAPEIQLQKLYLKELGRDIVPLEACSHSPYFDEILYYEAEK
jgi:hypothetical protein